MTSRVPLRLRWYTEVKSSDLREVLDGVDNLSRTTRDSPSSAAIFGRLRRDIDSLIQLRSSADRGAATNLPGWKIVGIILAVGVGYVTYVRCIEQDNCTDEQMWFLVAAGLASTIMTGACE